MSLAFYAPLKPPDHPIPSGDRTVARALLRALGHAGYPVEVASHFRSHEPEGCARRQRDLRRRGEAIARRLLERYRALPAPLRPKLWFTYHLYHKAPDWIGPGIAEALGIPYVVAEASHAGRQRGGAWSEGFEAAARAIRQAAAVICLNPRDVQGLVQLLGGEATVHRIAPFLDTHKLCRLAGTPVPPGIGGTAAPRLVCVAMMRAGDKLASYLILANAMGRLRHLPWELQVIGDGSARDTVQRAFDAQVPGRVRFLGALCAAQVPPLMARCQLNLWPAVNEAWGMVFLEAAALGVPSLAGDSGGVRAVVHDGETGVVVPVGDAGAFADALAGLLADPARIAAMGEAARERAERVHALPVAARRLAAILEPLL